MPVLRWSAQVPGQVLVPELEPVLALEPVPVLALVPEPVPAECRLITKLPVSTHMRKI